MWLQSQAARSAKRLGSFGSTFSCMSGRRRRCAKCGAPGARHRNFRGGVRSPVLSEPQTSA
eukprot:4981734-Alexandrium_andersonii.AAC.1